MTTHTDYNGHTTSEEVVAAFADQVEGRICAFFPPSTYHVSPSDYYGVV